MSDGFLLIDKPAGPTSHDVVGIARRALSIRRIGHAGTLDPFATGLLILLVGRATRLTRYLVGLPKQYTGVIRLGVGTDTLDPTGEVTARDDAWRDLDDDDVVKAMAALTGVQRQQPPAYSAKKVGGERAYRRVRRGEHVTVPEHDVEVFAFTMTDRSGPDVTFTTTVSGGTYVRSLARDLGEHLSCGAHLAELRRTEIGPFEIADAVPLEGFGPASLRPARDAVVHLPQQSVSRAEQDMLSQGRAIERSTPGSGPVALIAGDALVAIADSSGSQLKPRVVLVS